MNEPQVEPRRMPKPVGYNLFCAVPKADEKYEGSGLLKPDTQKHIEEHSTVVLLVLAMGPQAYADKERFPDGPYCKVGDFILVRAYSGTRLKIDGHEFRVLADDKVEAVVDDPRGITRA